MGEPQEVFIKQEPGIVKKSSDDNPTSVQLPKVVVMADLNVDPPEAEENDPGIVTAPSELTRLNSDDSGQDKITLVSKEMDPVEGDGKKLYKSGKSRSRTNKVESPLDCGAEAEVDPPGQVAHPSREEKVSSLKTGLIHVARKMPKNAHAHFILGVMYQRLGQPQKAILAYEKAVEILLSSELEIPRPELLSLVQIHHAQCLLLDGIGDNSFDKELEPEELEEILCKLKESMQSDIRRATLWNTLGLILLKSGRLQSAISVLSSLLAFVPENYDCIGNLGIAYLQSGSLELSAKCFQDLILKDQIHPAALINYATLLISKFGSVIAGAGSNADEHACADQIAAVNVAKECLLAALKTDPKAAHIWANLATVYHLSGDHKSSAKCLEKAAKLEPHCMSTRYAVAVHRIKDAERSQDPNEQLSWAGNEMASIIRDGDSAPIDPSIAWAGLGMANKIHHEIAAAYEREKNELVELEGRAVYCLKQAVAEDPDDAVQWHQLGLHSLCSQQYKAAQKYFKASIARSKECSTAWSNLGISLQLSEDPSQAEQIYKRALELAPTDQAHTIFSNLGNLYRQQKQYERAKAMFTKALKLRPGYAPAFNNLGLVFVAEGQFEEAKFCFEKAIQTDPLLDAAKSNMIKVVAMSRLYSSMSSCAIVE